MQRILIVGACLLALTGCGDKTTEPSALSGTMSVTFTGAGGGTFSASGIPPANPDISNSTANWAAGYVDTPGNQSSAAGVQLRPGAHYNSVILIMDRVTTGTATVDPGCNDIEATDCTGAFLIVNGNVGDEGSFEFFCGLLTGSVVITEVGSTRMKGTFSGSGECVDESLNVTSFTMTGGSFDVPRIAVP